jgi:FHS family L-fucose permease-like MFS transporter
MAVSSVREGGPVAVSQQESTLLPLLLMLTLYFGIGFITAMNDVLIPHFKDLFHLTNFRALLVQFAFFGAYFLLAIPSGRVIGRIGYKAGIVTALAVMGLGLFLFVPASFLLTYPLFLAALFIVGCGLALLQVAINPYLGALGDPARAASRLNLAGGFNSVAGTIAPRVGAAFIFVAAGASTAELARSVRLPYAILGVLALSLSVLTVFVPLPTVLAEKATDVKATASAWSFRHLRFGAVAIFTYVGAEVAIGSLLINYLGQPSMGSLTHVEAARYVSFYWGGAMIARFIGFFALRHVRQSTALAFVASLAACFIAFATFGHGTVALWALVSCGLFNSVMWPCIFPMAVEGLGAATSQGSGILVTMVVGGAIIPEIQALLADRFGYQPSFLVLLVCYCYILFFALNGYRSRVAVATQPEPAVLL